MINNNIIEPMYIKVPGGYLGLGHEAKFYSDAELKDCSYIMELPNICDDDAEVASINGQTDGSVDSQGNSDAKADSRQNDIYASQLGNISDDTGYSPASNSNLFLYNLPFACGYTSSYLTQADCREIEKQYVGESIKSNFSHAERRDKAIVDACVYSEKKKMDLEAADEKENMPHVVSEIDGFLYYISPSTHKKKQGF